MRRSSLVLPGLLGCAVALVGALGVVSAFDLFHRTAREAGWSVLPLPVARGQIVVFPSAVQGIDPVPAVYRMSIGDAARSEAWPTWSALPVMLVTLALLAALVWTAVAAWRGGLYAGRVQRLLGAAGLTALAGGPLMVVAAAIVAHTTRSAAPAFGYWQVAALFALLGAGLLAVREVLRRARDMHDELEAVI